MFAILHDVTRPRRHVQRGLLLLLLIDGHDYGDRTAEGVFSHRFRHLIAIQVGAHVLPGCATAYEAIHVQPEHMIEWLAALTPFGHLLKSGLFGT